MQFVTLRFAILGGSRAEKTDQKGATQLLSSAAFAGNQANSGFRLVRFFESFGAKINSTVDREKVHGE